MSLAKNVLRSILMLESEAGDLPFAKAYAKVALEMPEESEAFRVQLLYVLNNLRAWHGNAARNGKRILKRVAK